jgi:hypothetical protein
MNELRKGTQRKREESESGSKPFATGGSVKKNCSIIKNDFCECERIEYTVTEKGDR